MAEPILKGVNKKALEFFKGRGRQYLKLREDMVQYTLNPEDLVEISVPFIQSVANIVLNKIDEGEQSINQWIKTWEDLVTSYQAMLESPSTSNSVKADIQYKQDEAINILNYSNIFRNLYTAFRKNERIILNSRDHAQKNKDALVDAIKADNLVEVTKRADALSNNLAEYMGAFAEVERILKDNQELTGIEMGEMKVTVLPVWELYSVYLESRKAMVQYEQRKVENPALAPDLERATIALDYTISAIKTYVGPEKFKEFEALADKELGAVEKKENPVPQPQPTEDVRTKFSRELADVYSRLLAATKEQYSRPGWEYEETDTILEYKERLFKEMYQEIPLEEKQRIENTYVTDMEDFLSKYYGEHTKVVISKLNTLREEVQEFRRMDPKDPGLKARYDSIQMDIHGIVNSPEARVISLDVELDKDLDVTFRFHNPKIHDLHVDILTEEQRKALAQLGEQKAPTPVGPQEDEHDKKPGPTGGEGPGEQTQETTPSEEEDVQRYLYILRETNAQIGEINKLNNFLLLHNKLSELTPENILTDVNAERLATETSVIVARKRVELSEARYDYLKKHGKYILSNPEVKETKIAEIVFNTSFERFVHDRDELIVDAELRIKELNEKKPEGYETEIARLVAYIKAQNSLVSRFLVAESVSRRIDVVQFLAERNERRKSILASKLQAQNPENISHTAPVEEPTVNLPGGENKDEQVSQGAPAGGPVVPGQETPANGPVVHDEQVDSAPAIQTDPVPERMTIPAIEIKETKLVFNPREDKKVAKVVNKNDRLFMNSPQVTKQLIKNGVRITFSKQLRERLAELNAKISLVNNKVQQSRTSRAVDAQAEYQDVTFKEDHDVNFDDYSVEVRIPTGEHRTQVLFGDEEIHKAR